MFDYFHYIGVIIICILFLIFLIFHKKEKIQFAAPGILITAGIFFTFVGIAKGLWEFDVSNVDSSLPALLNGIKTAFWASAVGVLTALILKLKELFIKDIQESENLNIEGKTIDDIVLYQLKQIDELVEMNKKTKNLLDSIGGIEESSLVGQLKLFRMDSNEKNDLFRKESKQYNEDLINEFRSFAQTMAENNSKVFIEALKDVIKDFNQKITEQFGDNFKELNSAVEKTLEWQENYKTQMQTSIEQMSNITSILEKQVSDYVIVVENSKSFEIHASSMSKVLEEINIQRNHMETVVKSLANLVDNTAKELPKIGQQTNEMIIQTAQSAQSMIDTIKESNQNTIQSTQVIINSMQDNNKTITENINNQIKTMVDNNKSLTEQLNNSNQELSNQLSTSMKQATEDIQKQVLALDKELSEALTKSLESLAKQLASLSNKFTEDYTPLTDKLREVVQIASNLK
ncbi:hypothetical protein [Aliarcobacter butzleri]|uniref:hypothetical protein n=1 Tax=Aliarcobacter butzleri TaxID=28197 RepID=UPI003AF41345